MANIYAQFDDPAPAAPLPTTGNPYGQLDLSPLPALPAPKNIYAQFDDPQVTISDASAVPSTWDAVKDVAKSAGTGLVKGIAHLPAMLGDLESAASYYPTVWALKGAEKAGLLPAGTQASDLDATLAEFKDSQPSGPLGSIERAFTAPTSSDMDKVVTAVAGPYYQPQTTPGRYAETIGEFLPGSAMGGGSIAGKALRFGVLPAVASEAAGDATKGTSLEPWARGAAAIATGGIGSLATRPTFIDRTLARATRGATEADLDQAKALMHEAYNRGVPLTSAEALQAVTNGGTGMGRLQRLVEGVPEGSAVTLPIMARRPEDVARAVGSTLDTIAPATDQPSMIGVHGQEAAQGTIDQVNQRINRATRPFYHAAESQILSPQDFDPIARDPAFQASLRRLRADEVLGPSYEHLPDNSIAVVDAVSKDMRARGQALSNAANPGFQPETSAAYSRGATEARDIARDPARGGSPDYGTALAMQAQGRRDLLQPVQAGPLGTMAQTTDPLAQTRALFPVKPLEGAPAETEDAIRRLNAQNPDVAPALTRQHLATSFADASKDLQSGPNQFSGAKFATAVTANPIQRDVLMRGIAALPQPPRAEDVFRLLGVLRATGFRERPGSLTSYNNEAIREMGAPGALGAVAEAGKTLRPHAILGAQKMQ